MKNQEALAVVDHDAGQVVKADGGSIMDVIARAAADPNTDVNKLEKLLGMYERITARESEQQFNQAMNAAQTALRPIAADAANPQTKSKYASYQALDKVIRPVYTQQGFALSFDTGEGAPENYVRVVCRITHSGGHSQTHHVDMPADGKGAKGGDVMTKTHAVGSAMTYGARYLLKFIFNIAVGEADDDGNKAGSGDKITEPQAEQIRELIVATKSDIELFCKHFKVEAIVDLPAKDFDRAITALKNKEKK